MSENLLSKITVKSVIGSIPTEAVKIKDPETGKDKTVVRGVAGDYLRVYGQVKAGGTKIKTSEYGDSIEFAGDFRAVDLTTGELFSSAKLYLPNIAEQFLFAIVDSVEGDSVVQFGFDIGAKPSSSPVGYEYTVKPLIERSNADPLQALANSLPPLKLASPSK